MLDKVKSAVQLKDMSLFRKQCYINGAWVPSTASEALDIQNPATINEFAGIVKDADRLHALTLLTWADVNAVAPGAWTPSQESFLRELQRWQCRLLTGRSCGLSRTIRP